MVPAVSRVPAGGHPESRSSGSSRQAGAGRSGDGEPAPRRIRSLARGTGYARRAFRNLPRFSQTTGVGDGVKPDLSYVILTFLIR